MRWISNSTIAIASTCIVYEFLRYVECPNIGGVMGIAAFYLALFARIEQEFKR